MSYKITASAGTCEMFTYGIVIACPLCGVLVDGNHRCGPTPEVTNEPIAETLDLMAALQHSLAPKKREKRGKKR